MIAVLLVAGLGSAALAAGICGHTVTRRATVGPSRAAGQVAPSSRARLGPRWDAALDSAGLAGDPRRWARVALAATLLVSVVVGAALGPVGVALVLAAAPLAGLALRGALRRRRLTRADERLPEVLEQTARALRSGVDLVAALDTAAAAVPGVHGDELARSVQRVRAGAPLGVALAPWRASHGRGAVRLTIGALEVAAAAGGARARALDGVAATLRARAMVQREVRAVSSQATASAGVLVALPVAFGLISALADPRLAHVLVGTPAGLGCLVGAVILDALGALWMRRVLRTV